MRCRKRRRSHRILRRELRSVRLSVVRRLDDLREMSSRVVALGISGAMLRGAEPRGWPTRSRLSRATV
jgi:hypothetical protein